MVTYEQLIFVKQSRAEAQRRKRVSTIKQTADRRRTQIAYSKVISASDLSLEWRERSVKAEAPSVDFEPARVRTERKRYVALLTD